MFLNERGENQQTDRVPVGILSAGGKEVADRRPGNPLPVPAPFCMSFAFFDKVQVPPAGLVQVTPAEHRTSRVDHKSPRWDFADFLVTQVPPVGLGVGAA